MGDRKVTSQARRAGKATKWTADLMAKNEKQSGEVSKMLDYLKNKYPNVSFEVKEKDDEADGEAFDVALRDAGNEAWKAMYSWPAMNSAHEGFAVLKEEVDELWDHVKTRQEKRDLILMRKEAIQIAAMAIRFAAEVCNEERGRK